jgi:putative transposase
MSTPRPIASIMNLTRQQRDRAIARADFLACERDLYRKHGPTAARYLDDDIRRRLAYLGHQAGWKRIARDTTIAGVDTMRRWHRRLIAPVSTNTGGKPPIEQATIDLILVMATDNGFVNDAWGRRRISQTLDGLNIEVSPSSVRNILNRHGIPPAPKRGRGRDEPEAVIAGTDHAGTVAIDFCSAAVGLGDADSPLRRAYVLIAIHIMSRAATVIGITTKPDAAFMTQCAQALIGPGGFLSAHQATTIRMDHDGIFSPDFRASLIGLTVERTAVRCPWQNGHAERFVKTLKYGILRKAIWADEAGLRRACDLFIQHYLTERPHQALGGRVPKPGEKTTPNTGPVVCRRYLGGMFNHYYRTAC